MNYKHGLNRLIGSCMEDPLSQSVDLSDVRSGFGRNASDGKSYNHVGAVMIYIDAAKLAALIAELGKTDKDFCNHAGISRQAFYRLVSHGGPIMMATLRKISNVLGVSAASLVDRQRTPDYNIADF
jgi:DNA-binding Xre family transcriptional regulator